MVSDKGRLGSSDKAQYIHCLAQTDGVLLVTGHGQWEGFVLRAANINYYIFAEALL